MLKNYEYMELVNCMEDEKYRRLFIQECIQLNMDREEMKEVLAYLRNKANE